MVPNHFSTTNNLIQGIEEFIKTGVTGMVCRSTPGAQVSPLDPGTLHVIHRLDESSNESSAEVQRLRREVVEKESRIKELEAREAHFTQELDRLQCNMDELKKQFESYCKRNHPTACGRCRRSSELCVCDSGASQSETPESNTGSILMTQEVIQHFNTLGIDLKTFYTQMIEGDSVLPPFAKLPGEFQRHKSTKAARSKRSKILNFMNAYPNGPQACIANYRKLTASKFYDTEVKKSK